MKTMFATLLIAGLTLVGLPGYAQDDKAPPKPAAAAEAPGAAAKAAKPVDLGNTRAEEATSSEVIELLTFGEDLPLAKVIKDLAFQARTNIQFDPTIIATLPTNTSPAIRFENVTPQAALKAVLANYGLMIMGDPDTRIGRVIKKPTEEPFLTRVMQLKYSNPSNIAEIITKSFVKNKATAFPDPRTSQLVVAAIARDLEEITNLVALIDLPTRQVLIEAQIMETSKNPRSVKGIDWSSTLSGQTVSFGNGFTDNRTTTTTPGSSSSSTVTLPSGRTLSTSSTTGSDTKSEQVTTLSGLGTLAGLSANTLKGFNPSTAFLNADGLKVVLSYLNQDADTEVVATPREVVLDNEMAELSVTRAFPIFKFTPGSANIASGVDVTWTNLGTILKVTPRIAANDTVSMKVTPEVSNIDSKDRQTINGQVNEANVYAIRKIDTRVMIPSGSTLVMGGLISDSQTKSYSKVPILGDIPGLGYAFRRDSKSQNKQNLLIFITPTIVKDTDFQTKPNDFLQSKPLPKPDKGTSIWDEGAPHDWSKKK